MTDKEEIIIDGVDVSKCRYFLKDTEGQDYNTDEFVKGCCEAKGCYIGCEFIGYSICRGDKDCYFKQLARKSQECEQKDKELLSNEKIINKLMKEVDELRQECEELKRKVELMMDCPDCKVDEYKKALEEIEKVINNILNSCLGRNTVGCRPAHNVCGDLIKILDIINKAKGKE